MKPWASCVISVAVWSASPCSVVRWLKVAVGGRAAACNDDRAPSGAGDTADAGEPKPAAAQSAATTRNNRPARVFIKDAAHRAALTPSGAARHRVAHV